VLMQKGTANRLSVGQLYRRTINRASRRRSAAVKVVQFAENSFPG
jgi:hypothetical protein